MHQLAAYVICAKSYHTIKHHEVFQIVVHIRRMPRFYSYTMSILYNVCIYSLNFLRVFLFLGIIPLLNLQLCQTHPKIYVLLSNRSNKVRLVSVDSSWSFLFVQERERLLSARQPSPYLLIETIRLKVKCPYSFLHFVYIITLIQDI